MAPRPLIDILAEIPDPRCRQGTRYSLTAVLCLLVVAMLCGYTNYSLAIAWSDNYGKEFLPLLGFTKGRVPCVATLSNILKRLDLEAFEQGLQTWAESLLARTTEPALAIDGKTLRGSRKQGANAAHLLSVVGHRLGLTLYQQGVDAKTNEIPVCLEVLRTLLLTDRIVTVDALLTQREIAKTIVNKGGDYVMMAKGNQPTLQQDIAFLFQPQQPWPLPQMVAETIDQGHGRNELRRLAVIQLPQGYLDWPGAQQVFQIERQRHFPKSGKITHEIVYGLTSLSKQEATPERLLRLIRGYWTIENRSHWVRDVTFGEDHSQVRMGSTPQVMAALRNVAISLMRVAGVTKIAAACRQFAAQPRAACALLGIAS
jgi:predicted transposase YbfD/YdcC